MLFTRNLLILTFSVACCLPFVMAEDSKDEPLERARREVRLLDDIYKTSIVLITTHYVKDENDLPAGSAFKALFKAVEEKGWHKVRLVDASGEPYNPENAPSEGFEQRAIKQLLAGKPAYDEVIVRDQKRYLHAATAIPVVMDKCIVCHENYKDVPKGQAIGAMSYVLPIHE
ncbi:MAG: DUF3365 domain-containing protein [Planctomycetaceae bacterium]